MNLEGVPTVEAMVGLVGVPVVAALVQAIRASFPQAPQRLNALFALAAGVFWNALVISYAHGDMWRAPALGILSGLGALGALHIIEPIKRE